MKTRRIRSAFHGVRTTEDERFAILNISDRGKGKKGNALFYRDAKSNDKSVQADRRRDWRRQFRRDRQRRRQVSDPAPTGTRRTVVSSCSIRRTPRKNWKDVLPEKPEPLQGVSTAGGKLFVTYLKDVATRAYVYSLDGKLENEIKLPGLGTAGGFGGNNDDKFVFYTFTSFNFPPTIYKYDIATKKSTLFRAAEIPGFKSEDYETKQVFYNSKDGTRVPMFLVYKKGLKLDGNNPTLLYGYGGFNVTTVARLSARCAWRCSNRESFTLRQTCAAAASMARNGTRPERS